MSLTVGTAGHVDHGKTRLVAALTGKETDRLPEERRRGISIDLGYAPLDLPGGGRLSLVDVPGHERFVRTMVAGATGIDLFLLVVDAGEGFRPQTHEHLAILRLLAVTHGVVAITKVDAVDTETVELAVAEARELVPGDEVVPVSAVAGTGLDELRGALERTAAATQPRRESGPARLFVDRVFTLRGIGTVVTGTLWSGTIGEGDELAQLPGAEVVRVRSVQVHDRAVERAHAGQRVALALTGVGRSAIARGDVLVTPGAFPVSYRLEVELSELEPIGDGERLVVHHGTRRSAARVVRVGERLAQLRLAAPMVAARGDRLVLRGATTVGGGLVVDPAPPRRLDERRTTLLAGGEPREIVAALVSSPVRVEELAARALLGEAELEAGLDTVRVESGWAFSGGWLEEMIAAVESLLRERLETSPLAPGISVAELLPDEPWTPVMLPLLPVERRAGVAFLPGTAASLGEREGEARELVAQLERSGCVPLRVPTDLGRFLEEAGELVRLGDGFAVSAGGYEVAQDVLAGECASAGEITLARFRDLLGVGRRDAQLLLERFDADGLTLRRGDVRTLRKKP
ncbi:MAG: selenocysteine-specific translation elongation factor [Gaiellales bacterium]